MKKQSKKKDVMLVPIPALVIGVLVLGIAKFKPFNTTISIKSKIVNVSFKI